MKFIITLITLCFFNISHSQIELVKKDRSFTIGEVNTGLYGTVRLGYIEKGNEYLYFLTVNRRYDKTSILGYNRLEFNGKKKDLDYLYKLILDTFKQVPGEKTEVKIGYTNVGILTEVYKDDAYVRTGTINPYKTFIINNSRLFVLTKEELRILFNK